MFTHRATDGVPTGWGTAMAPGSVQDADVCVVGGGVVGVAVLLALARRGVSALLLESELSLGLSASGTNSGILHTGFDSKPGALETKLILKSAELRDAGQVLDRLAIPTVRCGARMTPKSADEEAAVDALERNARINGVRVFREPVQVPPADAVGKAGSTLRGSHHKSQTRSSLVIPGEIVTDPVAYVRALAGAAMAFGARVLVNAPVASVKFCADGDHDDGTRSSGTGASLVPTVPASRFGDPVVAGPGSAESAPCSRKGRRLCVYGGNGRVLARCDWAVNAAGLFADDVAHSSNDSHLPRVYPRKGEFVVMSGRPHDPAQPSASSPKRGPCESSFPGQQVARSLSHEGSARPIELPVPDARTKGVLVFPTVDGCVIAGPSAHDQADKRDWSARPEGVGAVWAKAVARVPEIESLPKLAEYAGLRPAGVDGANYCIELSKACPGLVHAVAIRSTGLSASLGIADYVLELLRQSGLVPRLAEQPLPSESMLTPLAADLPSLEALPWWRRSSEYWARVRTEVTGEPAFRRDVPLWLGLRPRPVPERGSFAASKL